MSSLSYRKKRIMDLKSNWNLNEVNNLYLSWEIPNEIHEDLKNSIKLYIVKL